MRSGLAGLGLTALIVAAGALGGCEDMGPAGPAGVGPGYGYGPGRYAAPPPAAAAPPPTAFDPNAFAWSLGAGPSSVVGKVEYRSASGERWTCAGQTIALIPATRYSAERMAALYGSRDRAVIAASEVRARNAQSPGVDYGRYVRTAACDKHDAFSFAGVQPGVYFLIARARPKGVAAGPDEGAVLMQRVQVDPGLLRVSVPAG